MTIEDTWGSDLATAAIAHLAHSTPSELLFTSTDFNSYVSVSTARAHCSANTAVSRLRNSPGWALAATGGPWPERGRSDRLNNDSSRNYCSVKYSPL